VKLRIGRLDRLLLFIPLLLITTPSHTDHRTQVLGANIDSPKCFPHQEGFWEDVNVAQCLKVSSPSILPYDTRDDLKR